MSYVACVLSLRYTHFHVSELFVLEMRNMYQMREDVSFITGSDCPNVSSAMTDMAEYRLWLTLLSQMVVVNKQVTPHPCPPCPL